MRALAFVYLIGIVTLIIRAMTTFTATARSEKNQGLLPKVRWWFWPVLAGSYLAAAVSWPLWMPVVVLARMLIWLTGWVPPEEEAS
jgi:hypothetical protein